MPKREKPAMPTEARRVSAEEAFYAAQEELAEHTSHTSHNMGASAQEHLPVQRTNVTYRMDTDVQALVERIRLTIGLQRGAVLSKSDVIELAVRKLAQEHGVQLGRVGEG